MAFALRLLPHRPSPDPVGEIVLPESDDPTRPELTVVPGRRRVAWFAIGLVGLIGGLMIGSILLHTTIAERQLEIDELERGVRVAQEDFDVLRARRAELRSPTRLAEQAAELGMVPAQEGEFVPVDPIVLAITIARTGTSPYGDGDLTSVAVSLEPLDQFRLVKSVSGELP